MRSKIIKRIRRWGETFLYDGVNMAKHALAAPRLVNQREVRVLGLQRTGNHAVINWIYRQTPEFKCYLNFVEIGANPFATFQKRGTIREFEPEFHSRINTITARMGWLKDKETLIYSYEDESLADAFANPRFERSRRRWLGDSAARYDVLILRDPYNLFASRLKKERDFRRNRYSLHCPQERRALINLWKSYAKEFLGDSSVIATENKVPISYNRWFTDREYRRRLAERLGLEFTDDGASQVLPIGGGSSFDRIEKNAEASKMKVLERWRHFQDDPVFTSIFKNDDELTSLSQRIFGDIPGTGELLKS